MAKFFIGERVLWVGVDAAATVMRLVSDTPAGCTFAVRLDAEPDELYYVPESRLTDLPAGHWLANR